MVRHGISQGSPVIVDLRSVDILGRILLNVSYRKLRPGKVLAVSHRYCMAAELKAIYADLGNLNSFDCLDLDQGLGHHHL